MDRHRRRRPAGRHDGEGAALDIVASEAQRHARDAEASGRRHHRRAGNLVAAARLRQQMPCEGTRRPFARLFATGYALRKLLLWGYSFLIFAANCALGSWVPVLLTSFGFAPAEAPRGLAAIGIGGVVGNIVFMPLVARFGARKVLVASAILAIAGVLAAGMIDLPQRLVLLALAAVGAGLITSSVGRSAFAVSIYPSEIRTTGVGWSAAMGRAGSIVVPAVGGAMLAFHWPARDVAWTACLPVLGAIAILAALSWHDRRRCGGDPASASFSSLYRPCR